MNANTQQNGENTADGRPASNGELYKNHGQFLVERHKTQKLHQANQMKNQYESIVDHGQFCGCYFCNPIV